MNCDELPGRLRDLCRGYDDVGKPIGTRQQRAKWKKYFQTDDGKRTAEPKEKRRARVKEVTARTQRLIGWLTFFRLPSETGIGDTASRLIQVAKHSPDAHTLIKRLLTMCSCSRSDAIAKLNAEYPYPANTRNLGGS